MNGGSADPLRRRPPVRSVRKLFAENPGDHDEAEQIEQIEQFVLRREGRRQMGSGDC
jgi:hypothetical protein